MIAFNKFGNAIRLRRLRLGAILLALTAVTPAASADSGGYGELIAHGAAGVTGTAEAGFHHVRAPQAFWLVLTDSADTRIHVSWSIGCVDPERREHGSAAGQATVAHGRWIKRIRPDWIAQPAFCSGVVRGSAGGSPVQIHVYAR